MTEQAKRWSKRRRREGMTLVEMMIVVIIMAMIAAAVGVAVLPQLQRAKLTQARTDARAIQGVSTTFLLDHNDCPTVDQLRDGHFLERGTRHLDPWDTPFAIECDEAGVVVTSAGPNEQIGDGDDVRTDEHD